MLTWITENLASLIAGTVVLGIVVLVVIKLVKDKRNNKSACGCGCANCPYSASCSKTPQENNK